MTPQPDQLLRVATRALDLTEKMLPHYTRAKCPHKFTQPQLLACLVLRLYLDTTFRGMSQILNASVELQRALQLGFVPHYSTLKHFANRSNGLEVAQRLLCEILPPAELADRRPDASQRTLSFTCRSG